MDELLAYKILGIDMQDAVAYLLVAVSLFAWASPTWRWVGFTVLVSTLSFILVKEIVLEKGYVARENIGYVGGIMSASFGFIVAKYGSKIPSGISSKNKKRILFSVIAVSVLFILEFIVAVGAQASWNFRLPKENLFNTIYNEAMFTITALQSLLLIGGAIDGLNKISNILGSYLAYNHGYSFDKESGQAIPLRKEDL